MDLERVLTAEDTDRAALRADLEDAANEIPLDVDATDAGILEALQDTWGIDTTESRGSIGADDFTDTILRTLWPDVGMFADFI
jgi:hypothetical protein